MSTKKTLALALVGTLVCGSAVAFTLIVIMLVSVTIYMRLIARLHASRDDQAIV